MEYICIRNGIDVKPAKFNRLLLAINHWALRKDAFFKVQTASDTLIARVGESVCSALSIQGLGGREAITPHSVRVTCCTRLLGSGESRKTTGKWTGNDPKMVLRYYNLRGTIGNQQQDPTIFPGSKRGSTFQTGDSDGFNDIKNASSSLYDNQRGSTVINRTFNEEPKSGNTGIVDLSSTLSAHSLSGTMLNPENKWHN